jgi:hypothetical protein
MQDGACRHRLIVVQCSLRHWLTGSLAHHSSLAPELAVCILPSVLGRHENFALDHPSQNMGRSGATGVSGIGLPSERNTSTIEKVETAEEEGNHRTL